MPSDRHTRYHLLTRDAVSYAKRWEYYYRELTSLLAHLIPHDASVIQIGSGVGNVLTALPHTKKSGVELGNEQIQHARAHYPGITWHEGDFWDLSVSEQYDYALLSEVTDTLDDLEVVFRGVRRLLTPEGRLVIVSRSPLWKPFFRIAHLLFPSKTREAFPSLLTRPNLEHLLFLSGFEVVRSGRRILMPFHIPVVSYIANRILGGLPFFSRLGVLQYVVARPLPQPRPDCSVSIIIAARNERGNIRPLLKRIPDFASSLEIIFVEGNSSDGTWEEIQDVVSQGPRRVVRAYQQEGRGKWDAVQKGLSQATGELLMILDADMTVPPEDLPRFYATYLEGRGDVINGSRLIYPMERGAMRFLNTLGNLFFATLLSMITRHRFTDTLCGTKVFRAGDWHRIRALRSQLRIHDPFGDFELLFGASWLNLHIVDLPIRYRDRRYGTTQINRFRDGWLLLKLCIRAWYYFRFF